MICTFGDVTDVVWWRELSLPVRAVIQPNGTFRPVVWGERGWESVDAVRAQMQYDQLAGLSATKARARIVELLRESGDLLGDPRPITHAVKFFEKGDRPLEIVTSRQWFIKTMEFRERPAGAGPRDRVASAVHAKRGSRTGSTAWTATGASAGSGSSACRSRSGTSSATDGTVDYESPPAAGRIAAADRSVHGRPRGLHAGPARPARRIHRRSRRHGHLGDIVADAADRRPLGRRRRPLRARVPDGRASAGARHHPHLAVLDAPALGARARHESRGRTPRSPAGCSIPTARRCRSRRATSSRRWGCSRSTGPTACATGRRAAAREPTPRSTPGQMKVGRRLAIKLLNASKFVLSKTDAGRSCHRSARSRAAVAARGARGLRDQGARGLQLRERARHDREVLLGLLRRLSRAGEGASERRLRRRGRGLGHDGA